jgi:ribosomal protein S6
MPIDSTEETIKSTQEKVSNFIVENQGTIYKIDEVSKRRLGESVKGNSSANMATLSFYLAPEKIEDLKKNLKGGSVLKYIVLYKEPRKEVAPRRMRPVTASVIETATEETKKTKTSEKPKKVEIKEIEKKLEEILGE